MDSFRVIEEEQDSEVDSITKRGRDVCSPGWPKTYVYHCISLYVHVCFKVACMSVCICT